jgi:hypothetical protein
MINIRPPIEQRIREQVPDFAEVAGAVSLQAIQQGLIPNKGCYVMLDRVTAGDNQTRNTDVTQKVMLSVAVVIVVKNVRDARGADAADTCAALQDQIHAALLGWRHSNEITPIEYQAGQLLSYSGGFYVWKDSFKTNHIIKGNP